MARAEIKSEMTGKVWKITSSVGASLDPEEPIMIIESMKMECPVAAERQGRILELLVAEGDAVEEGQTLAVMEL